MSKDFYATLGVSKSASEDEIKRAFRKKAHEVHPDKTGGDEAKFKEVNEAYQVLGNKDKRAHYDRFGTAEPQGGFGGQGFGGGGFQGFGGFGGADGVQFDMNDLGDLFGGVFGGGRQRETQGHHIRMDVALPFAEAVFGTEREVTVHRDVSCVDCTGSGAENGSAVIDCMQCGGTGREIAYQRTMLGTIQTARTCSRCAGRGKMSEKPCRACSGTGLTKGSRTMNVRIPAGIDDGETLRLVGEGEPLPYAAGRPGDLYLTVRVRPDDRFTREGFDIRAVAEIDIPTAALGGTLTVPTVDGDTTLKIPAGTQPGTVFRLKGKGVPFLKRTGRGDQYVDVHVVIPKKLTRKQKQALEDWGK